MNTDKQTWQEKAEAEIWNLMAEINPKINCSTATQKIINWIASNKELIGQEEDKPLTPAEEIVMNHRCDKLKERGDTESGILLTKMVHTNKPLYNRILDSNLSYYFNELSKKAIAFDKSQSISQEGKETTTQ